MPDPPVVDPPPVDPPADDDSDEEVDDDETYPAAVAFPVRTPSVEGTRVTRDVDSR